MDTLTLAVLLAAAFVGSHVGLATQPVRSRLVARLGERGFRAVFFAVAATSLAVLTVYYADHRTAGGPGLALGGTPALRLLLTSLVVTGITLMVASFWGYPGSPYDLEHPNASRPARGLERITRHPFMVGMTLFAGAHALLAVHGIAAVLMAALAVLAVFGPLHLDAKLTRRRGQAFADYLTSTSAVPFAAILAGRQRLVWHELPWSGIVTGLAIAIALRSVHDDIFAHRGAWVILVAVGGPVAIMVAARLRDRPRAARRTGTAPAGNAADR